MQSDEALNIYAAQLKSLTTMVNRCIEAGIMKIDDA